jgi:hypothetical protein
MTAGVWGRSPQRAEMRAGGMGEQRESRAKGTYRKLVYKEGEGCFVGTIR